MLGRHKQKRYNIDAREIAGRIFGYCRDNCGSLDSERHVDAIEEWVLAFGKESVAELKTLQEDLSACKKKLRAAEQLKRDYKKKIEEMSLRLN